MEITGKNPSGNILTHVQNETEKKRINLADKQDSSEKVVEDKVELSPRAREILEATKRIHSVSDFEIEKVLKLKQQMDNGVYQVDGQKIAFKMLQEFLLNQIA